MTELWRYQSDGATLASAVGIDGGRVRLEVGVPDGVIAEEPGYEIELGPEEAKALGQRLIRWADPMIGIRG